jgi:phosphate transport system permease protein
MPTNPFNPDATHVLPEGQDTFGDVDLGSLEKSLLRPRNMFSFALTSLTTVLTLGALVPLFAVLIALTTRGFARINVEALTSLPPKAIVKHDEDEPKVEPATKEAAKAEAAEETVRRGGFGNAILGTLVIVGLALLITIPFGILGAIYLAEFNPKSQLARALRFCAKLLTGFPSVLAGVFAYGIVVLLMGNKSALAGAVALTILMIPTVLLTAEDAIRMVPHKMKEAAIGMGATPTQVVWHVLLPTAFPGILTGVMLAVARAAGETAPLLFTVGFSRFWIDDFGEVLRPMASLAVLVFNFYGSSDANQQELAWAASLVLVLLVLAFNIVGQSLSPKMKHS